MRSVSRRVLCVPCMLFALPSIRPLILARMLQNYIYITDYAQVLRFARPPFRDLDGRSLLFIVTRDCFPGPEPALLCLFSYALPICSKMRASDGL